MATLTGPRATTVFSPSDSRKRYCPHHRFLAPVHHNRLSSTEPLSEPIASRFAPFRSFRRGGLFPRRPPETQSGFPDTKRLTEARMSSRSRASERGPSGRRRSERPKRKGKSPGAVRCVAEVGSSELGWAQVKARVGSGGSDGPGPKEKSEGVCGMGGERHRRDAVSPELFGSSRYRRGGDWRGLGRADGLCARRRGLGRAARAIGGLAPAEGARGPGSDEGAADGSGAGGDNEAPALSGVGVLRRRRVIRPGTRRWTVMMGIHGYAGNSIRVMERITLAGPRLGGRVWVGGCGGVKFGEGAQRGTGSLFERTGAHRVAGQSERRARSS